MTEPPKRAAAETTPLDVDGVAATTWGTAAWIAALAVLLLTGVRFDDPRGWWLSTCLVGAALGIAGIWFTRRRRAVYRAHAAAQQAADTGPQEWPKSSDSSA